MKRKIKTITIDTICENDFLTINENGNVLATIILSDQDKKQLAIELLNSIKTIK